LFHLKVMARARAAEEALVAALRKGKFAKCDADPPVADLARAARGAYEECLAADLAAALKGNLEQRMWALDHKLLGGGGVAQRAMEDTIYRCVSRRNGCPLQN
jgi:hypothetical protein